MKAEKVYLSQAGFVIEIVFESSEFVFIRNSLIAMFRKIWGSYLVLPKKEPDFTIRVVSDVGKDQILVREKGKKYYFLSFSKDFKHRKVTIYYSAGIRVLVTLFKEIFAYLAEKDGFLLHCSSLKDRKGRLLAFVARSGGGKSTTANLLNGNTFSKFSDDIIIVRKIGGKWKFFSPPFVEKEGIISKREASSAKFYIIKKSTRPYLIELGKDKDISKKNILPFLLGQIWLRDGVIGKKVFSNAVFFLKDNVFYELGVALNRKKMEGLLNEN